MTRSDKKNTICEHCGHKYSTPQKLRDHLNRKFKCKPLPPRLSSTPQAQRVPEGSKGVPKELEPVQIPNKESTPKKTRGALKKQKEKEPVEWIYAIDRKPGEK